MNILTIVILLLSFINVGGGSESIEKRNTERKNDINNIYSNLEKHYAQYGYYPTSEEFINDKLNTLPGVDLESYIDPNGKKMPQGDYSYSPSQCRAVGCDRYILKSTLESEDDSVSEYKKENLN